MGDYGDRKELNSTERQDGKSEKDQKAEVAWSLWINTRSRRQTAAVSLAMFCVWALPLL